MANIINLATETKQDEIIANVVNVKETVNAVNTNVNNVNTNVNANKSTLATVNANLGTPTSGASNATGSNAHAKLNYINSMLGTINNNAVSAKAFNMFESMPKIEGLASVSTEAAGSINTSLTGKMLLKGVTITLYAGNYWEHHSTLCIDGKILRPSSTGYEVRMYTISELYVNSYIRVRNGTKGDLNYGNSAISYKELYLFS